MAKNNGNISIALVQNEIKHFREHQEETRQELSEIKKDLKEFISRSDDKLEKNDQEVIKVKASVMALKWFLAITLTLIGISSAVVLAMR